MHQEFSCLIPFVFYFVAVDLEKKQHMDGAPSPAITDCRALLLSSTRELIDSSEEQQKGRGIIAMLAKEVRGFFVYIRSTFEPICPRVIPSLAGTKIL